MDDNIIFNLNKERCIMSKVKKLISIAAIFSMSLIPIYGYAGDVTHYRAENHVVVQEPIVVVGAVLRSLGDSQFCISSTIGNPGLVPFIFTKADQLHEKEIEITDVVNTFSSMGVPLCAEQKEVQYVNTTLVDSKVYSNQKRVTFVDRNRIRGLVNNNIKIKTGELFHLQVLPFTSITDEEMVTSMEAAIEEVQEVYTRIFSDSNNNESEAKRIAMATTAGTIAGTIAGIAAGTAAGTIAGVVYYMLAKEDDSAQ